MEKQNIRIKLRTYDNKILDASTEEIVNTVKRTGATIKGPIYCRLELKCTFEDPLYWWKSETGWIRIKDEWYNWTNATNGWSFNEIGLSIRCWRGD